MKRSHGRNAVALVLITALSAAAQSSIVERLGDLREGWSFASDRKAEPQPTPVRVAQRRNAAAPVASPAPPAPLPFPRVNPQELLPRNWFGAGNTAPKPTPTTSASSGAGSARERLLRDMQRPASGAPIVENAASGAPKGRAGSVLTPGAPQVSPSPSTVASKNARLARSIAAEAAEAIESPEATGEEEPLATLNEAEPVVAGAEAAPEETPEANDEQLTDELFEEIAAETEESLLPFGPIEGTTPTEEADQVANDQVTPDVEPVPADLSQQDTATEAPNVETESAAVKVAAKPSADARLPLFIGDRYSTINDAKPVEVNETAPAEEPSDKARNAFAAGPATSRSTAAPSYRSAPVVAATPAVDPEPVEDDLLFTQRMPVLVSKVSGPRTIVVGREANYRVLLANRGDVGADRVETRVTLPEGAEVVGARSADGTVNHDSDSGQILWNANHLAAGEIVKLDLRLIARTGSPIELGVAHSHRPIDGRTLVEVQEPKLQLSLLGPDEVLFGKPQVFRLTLSNPGTGAAENVSLILTPPGGDSTRTTSHDFGVIGAGEERTVEIELTAREAGELAVNASATADGDVTADVTKEVFCRKPELVVDWRGPTDRYAGAPALYYFRVRNPGTATAPDVVLNVELPAGFEITPSAQTPQPQNGRLAYRVGALRAGDDRYFELRGVMRSAGANQITLRAAGSDETRSDAVTAVTEVVALADLKLDVLDPKGPVATGQEVAYEIRVTNRGSNVARDVRIVGLFSDGIEPHHADGGECEMRDGRVAFDMIEQLAAGETRTLTIHARAHEEGTHLFRAEVLCRDLEIKLAAEETTRFFVDEPIDVADGYPSGRAGQVFPR